MSTTKLEPFDRVDNYNNINLKTKVILKKLEFFEKLLILIK